MTRNIVRIAYLTDTSLSSYKDLLKIAESGNKAKITQDLRAFYDTMFSDDGVTLLKTMLADYQKKGMETFSNKVTYDKFIEAVNLSAAVNMLLHKKSAKIKTFTFKDKVLSFKERIEEAKKLISFLFAK